MLFDLDLDNNITLSYFLFCLIIDVYFLIAAAIAQEAKTEIEIRAVLAKAKIRKCSV